MLALRNAPGRPERARLEAVLGSPTAQAARGLIGQVLVRRMRGGACAARIVETEAYLGEGDPPLTLREGSPPRRLKSTPRVGIRHAAGRRLRFVDPASPVVSSGRPGVV